MKDKDTVARLVFDSWAASVPEIRSEFTTDRHLIYEGCGMMLDLILKPASAGAYLQIEGQVIPQDDKPEKVCQVPVLIENGERHLQTLTNALGEFTFTIQPADGCLELTIGFGDQRLVVHGLESVQPRNWQIHTPAVMEQRR